MTTGVRFQGQSTHRKAFKGLSELLSSVASTCSNLTAFVPILSHQQLRSPAIYLLTTPGDLSQHISIMGENNATREKLSISVPKGTCCQASAKSPLSIGSPLFFLDPHQLASTLPAKCGSIVMAHASEGERKACARSFKSISHVTCGNMIMYTRYNVHNIIH